MFRYRLRAAMTLFASLILLSAFSTSALAQSAGIPVIPAFCREILEPVYTDTELIPFKNRGQCTRYLAHEHKLPDLYFTDDISDGAGVLTGINFPPNTGVTQLTGFYQDESLVFPNIDLLPWDIELSTDAKGSFTTSSLDLCMAGGPSVTITAIAGGVTYSESFPLSCA